MSTYQSVVFILLALVVIVGTFVVLFGVHPRERQWPWPTEGSDDHTTAAESSRPTRDGRQRGAA